jgi:hypothetical protein
MKILPDAIGLESAHVTQKKNFLWPWPQPEWASRNPGATGKDGGPAASPTIAKSLELTF